MLNPPALAPAVVAVRPQAIPVSTVAFRSIHLRHFSNFAAAQPLFAAGGGTAGSRYVLPGGPAALYAALDADTAHREGNQVFYQTANTPAGPALLQAGGLRPDPVVVIGIHIQAARMLDLRDPVIRAHLGILAVAELTGPWRFVPNAPTQILGDTVFNDGHFDGILYPSVQNPGHDCIALFPARLTPPSGLDFLDPVTGLASHIP